MTCLIMTLEEMLKLALGTTTPDHINIAVLHSFLKILIQKLEMQTDFVEIAGPEVGEIRQMLCQAQNPIVEFKCCADEFSEGDQCYTSEKVTNMEEEIRRLTDIVGKMEVNLKAHLDAMELCKQPPAASTMKIKKQKPDVTPVDDDSFSSECEDPCIPCDEPNLIACKLLQNRAFLKKLMRRVTSPVIDRIFTFEKLIGILNEKFQNFLNTAEDEYKKIPLIEDCLAQLELLRIELGRHKTEFITTMEEIQEMLDAKVDKVHIPPLKKHIMDRMDQIERQLLSIINKEQCPKAAGVIMNNVQCLCCTTRVCQMDRVYPVPLLAHIAASPPGKPTTSGKLPQLCIPRDRDRACGGDHTIIRPYEKSLRHTNLIDDFGDKMKLQIGAENVEYFKGIDGGMYRMAPNQDGPCKGN